MMNCEPENDHAEMKSPNDDATSVGGFKVWGLSCAVDVRTLVLNPLVFPFGHQRGMKLPRLDRGGLLLDLTAVVQKEEQSDKYTDTDYHASGKNPSIVLAIELQMHEEPDDEDEFPEGKD